MKRSSQLFRLGMFLSQQVRVDEKRGKPQISCSCDVAVISYENKILLSSKPTQCPLGGNGNYHSPRPLSMGRVNVHVCSHRGF